MKWIPRRLRHLFFGARSRKELDEEMAFHIEALTDDLVRQGMDPRQARHEARIRFGNRERIQERTREERGLALFDEASRNLRFALRGLARNPLFSTTFVATLALCVGLTTAVVGVVDATLWRGLPYPDAHRLGNVIMYNPALGRDLYNEAVDGRTWERLRDEAGFAQRAVYSSWAQGVNLSTDEAAAYVQQQRVGAGYFATLGVSPSKGREFDVAEDMPGGPAVAILSHGLWSRTFGSDPDVIGRQIQLKGESFTVVGVMPSEFRSHVDADVWTPLRPTVTGEGSGTNYTVLLRAPAGMSLTEAEARLASIAPPDVNAAGSGDDEVTLRFGVVALNEALNAGSRTPLMVLLGGVLLMFLVGCANLAGLQIARSIARTDEMATRQALGSGTPALVRQTMTENALLGSIGAAAGLCIAAFAIPRMEALARTHFGVWQAVAFDGRTVAGALAIAILATLLFTLVPVLQVGRSASGGRMASGRRVMGGGSHRLRKAILVGQVSIVTALLFGAGLVLRSYGFLMDLDPGFDAQGVVAAQVSLDDARYGDADAILRLFDDGLERMRAIPGVTSAAVSLTLPYERPLNLPFGIGDDDQQRVTNAVYVTPGLFETLGIPLLQGRDLSASDRADAPLAVVVNQVFVDRHMADGRVIGERLQGPLFGQDGAVVVGVVGDVQQQAGIGGGDRPVWESPTIYIAAAQFPANFLAGVHVWFSPHWIVRSAQPAAEVGTQVAQVLRQVAPDLPLARSAALTDVMASAFARQRFEAGFLLAVAAFALLLASIGLYGIVAHEVTERRREMGLRMALGATPGNAVWTAGAAGLRLAALGLLIGSVVAMGGARVLERLVYGVTPHDPVTLGLPLLLIGALAAAASFLPAARLGRLDPAAVLRNQ